MSSPQVESTLGNVDDRPLTPKEYALVQRMFSDPFSIPQAFKTWLVSYLETTDLTLPLGAVLGLSGAIAASSPDILGAIASGTTDSGGALHVAFPSPVSVVRSVVLTNVETANLSSQFVATDWSVTGFDIVAWDITAGVALALTPINVAWLAFVTP